MDTFKTQREGSARPPPAPADVIIGRVTTYIIPLMMCLKAACTVHLSTTGTHPFVRVRCPPDIAIPWSKKVDHHDVLGTASLITPRSYMMYVWTACRGGQQALRHNLF